jgi:hypothetical protein
VLRLSLLSFGAFSILLKAFFWRLQDSAEGFLPGAFRILLKAFFLEPSAFC